MFGDGMVKIMRTHSMVARDGRLRFIRSSCHQQRVGHTLAQRRPLQMLIKCVRTKIFQFVLLRAPHLLSVRPSLTQSSLLALPVPLVVVVADIL